MCGFCGEIRSNVSTPDLSPILLMNDALTPRGPDSGGVFQQGRLAVGHRRLKIIDLSEQAQQPMVDNELGLGIVFNGTQDGIARPGVSLLLQG